MDTRNSNEARPVSGGAAMRWGARLLLATCLVLIADIALTPGHALPPSLLGFDKAQHVFAFFALGVIARIAWPRTLYLLPAIGLALYGAGIEFAQAEWASGRTASAADFAADILGLVAAWLLITLVRLLR